MLYSWLNKYKKPNQKVPKLFSAINELGVSCNVFHQDSRKTKKDDNPR